MRMSEIRRLKPEQRDARLKQYRRELMDLRSMLSAGGSIDNPGRIGAVKRTIARLITVKNEEALKQS